MDIERLIAEETARERALWARLQEVERELAPYEERRKVACATWCQAEKRLESLKLMKSLTEASAGACETVTGDDVAVLESDRRELAASEAGKD